MTDFPDDACPPDQASPAPLTAHTISSEGLTLAVWKGPDNGPPIVFVHGYPDTHVIWDPVIGLLRDRFSCIAYDVRGAGASDAPASRADYFTPHLVTDLVAVLDGFSPDRPVHVVGHDWGSVQAWDAVLSEPTDERLTGRIASFTSISGPSLDSVRSFGAAAWRGGWNTRRQALEQAARSWYVYAFQVPFVPELVVRRLTRQLVESAAVGGLHFADTLPTDARNGVNLYRANFWRRPRLPDVPTTALPVQLVVPLRDPYITPALANTAKSFATNLTRVDIDAGHWVPRTHPEELASILDFFRTEVDRQEE